MRGGWFLAALLTVLPASADEKPLDDATFFRTQVRPILSDKCFKCHGPATSEADLRLDEREFALSELPSGTKAIVPGTPESSELLRRITSDDEFEKMPPPEIGKSLSHEQIVVLEEWVRRGAPYAEHWAYERDRAVVPPAPASDDWCRNPIDAFILERLNRRGLAPAAVASPETLIRRVSLDLVGLLPPSEAVTAFVNDDRADAYDRLVERLLASPHFGERQARHWLDLARYADSNGYTIDSARTIWPYRDWVIDAFNANKSFDEFTIEQLAGDLLPKPTTDRLIATGFQRNTPLNEEGGTDPEQFRVERTVDRTNTIGFVWLGLTVACSQCHDHKFDAISQKEYYQLYAFFNSVDEPALALPTPEQEREKTTLQTEIRQLRKELKEATETVAVEPTATDDITSLETAKETVKTDSSQALKERLAAAEEKLKRLDRSLVKTLILRKRAEPRTTHIHNRGDFLDLGDEVQPDVIASLPPLEASETPATRLDLARWLVRDDHPLTPRVVVNRIWQRYFGVGLVETESDFGVQGAFPTHPELLDWLAEELVRSGWNIKHIHRLIVTSATYRQSSAWRDDAFASDPRNQFLARQNRLRLEAEILRDAALSASGLLCEDLGGPGVFPPQPDEVFSFTQAQRTWKADTDGDRYRRGMYTFLWRQSQHPLMTTFDGPDAQTSCTRRNRSNTPLQALHLANNRAFVEFASGLAERVAELDMSSDADRIDYAFRLCLARKPSSEERELLLTLLRDQQAKHPETAWLMVARTLLNLDEFVTRE